MTSPMAAFRPFLMLAAVAFTVGFLGYWMLARPAAAVEPDAGWRPALSAPQSEDWNVARRI
jgi:hypothetical protein